MAQYEDNDIYEEYPIQDDTSSNDSVLRQLEYSLGLKYRRDIIFMRYHKPTYFINDESIRIEPSSYINTSYDYNVLIGDAINEKILIVISGYNKCAVRRSFDIECYIDEKGNHINEFKNTSQVRSFILAHTRD